MSAKISRRKFIVRSLAGGTVVLLGSAYLGRNALRRKLYRMVEDPELALLYMGDTSTPSLWFEISEDNTITFHCPKIEMGQGTHTGLAQIAAEELEVPIESINTIHAATSQGNIDQFGTGGSTSVAGLWQPLRELAATMRQMLVDKAAEKLEVSADQLTVSDGVISGNGQSMTYGEVVADVEDWKIPAVPELKPSSSFRYIGKPVQRVDLEDKIYGSPIFGLDAEMQDMLYGAVVRSSKIGAKYKGSDITAAASMPGVVKVIQEPDFVGVVAKTLQQAENARDAIVVDWEVDRDWELSDIEEIIKNRKGASMIIQKEGKAARILDNAEDQLVSAEYSSPIGSHAQLEPNGCVANFSNGKVTLMISTQVVNLTRNEVADRLGIEAEDVNLIPTYLGGGFGRRLHTPNAMQAAIMSKAVGKPVKSFFNRQEEFQNDTFRPPTHHKMRGRLTADGMIEAIEHDYSSGDVMYGSPLLPGFASTVMGTDGGAIRGAMIQYRGIKNMRAIAYRAKLPFATSWWRSLGLLANTFAIESFIDELAEKAGINPVQFRLNHIQDNEEGRRLRKVIEVCADKAGYIDQANSKRAMGFAASTDVGTPVAQVAEVVMEGDTVRVDKVTCVIDPGFAVNPDQVRAQCEGSINMGISAAMFEEMTVSKGELQPIIYGPYKMAMLRHTPRVIDVEIINSSEKPGAVGEPPLGPIGAAVANAIYRLTGKRVRNMPLSNMS